MLPAAYSREDFGNFSFSLGGRLVLLLARHCHVQGLWLKVLLTAKSQDLLQNSQILRLARYMQMESSCCFYSLTEKECAVLWVQSSWSECAAINITRGDFVVEVYFPLRCLVIQLSTYRSREVGSCLITAKQS